MGLKKFVLGFLVVLVVSIIGLIVYVKVALPIVDLPEEIKVAITPTRVERGRYLAHSVAVCMDCHSERDWSKFSAPLIDRTLGQGGEEFSQEFGFPGRYFAKNITPSGIGEWTDGELLRAITVGVNNHGKALFPVMPYLNYGKMDREDVLSIIAYIRTLAPIKKDIPASESDFPMNFIINTLPQPAVFTTKPDTADKVAYGKYLFTTASCADCHTQQDKGQPIKELELAGGFKFPLATGGTVFSANITPDRETGIGNLSEDNFVNRFKIYSDSSYVSNTVGKGDYNTFMPWVMYSGMSRSDLAAIYAYLKTVKPINNRVVKFVP